MKWLLLAGMLAATRPTQLPPEMLGYWQPFGAEHGDHNWPGPMKRIPEPGYEWEVSKTEWLMWDGVCKIHDVKELGENDYEVWATCGLIKGYKPYEMDEREPTSEDHYQFTLCGTILNVRELKDRPPNPHEECKADAIS